MQKYGDYRWTCPVCNIEFRKDTPQGLGLAKSNHRRGHWAKWEVENRMEKIKSEAGGRE